MILEIQTVGNPVFPRFIIANDQGEVFDGTAWTQDRDRALMFVEGQQVAVQFNALQESVYHQVPLREFTVPLNIRVRSTPPFTQKQLEEYLERAVAIMIDQDKGTGPVEDSMVQLVVTWSETKEMAVAKNTDKR